MTQENNIANEILARAQRARDIANWAEAINLYQRLSLAYPSSAQIAHNLGLSYFGLGKSQEAARYARKALQLEPALWQSAILLGKAHHANGQMTQAWDTYKSVMNLREGHAEARIGLADLAMNQFGDTLSAQYWVKPLLEDAQYQMDAQLTCLMANLYDRPKWNFPGNAAAVSKKIKVFSDAYLQLPNLNTSDIYPSKSARLDSKKRPRVGIISPLFCASPVYFLTISGWRHVAKGCEIIIFNRGHHQDWATIIFQEMASAWHDVQHMSAEHLAHRIVEQDLDVLYDLGGWMDPVALKALSIKPAKKMYKWVGGQSVTTGQSVFDGWIGDSAQSPKRLQHLYTEPLIQIPRAYCTYTPPDYLPSPAQKKSSTPCIFANPAKVSSDFLERLRLMKRPLLFIHRQYQFTMVQDRIRAVLGSNAHFAMPSTHQEALQLVNQHDVMIDTFPYSSGLTAQEALAMGTKVQVLEVGSLFCERHTARLWER